MVTTVPVRLVAFLWMAGCVALCQQPEQKRAENSLPDAPSARASTSREYQTVADEARASVTGGRVVTGAGAKGASEWPDSIRAWHSGFGTLGVERPTASSDFLGKHLYSVLVHRNSSYHPLTSGSLLGRATYAASRPFVARDVSGKSKLNTSYFLGVLGAAVAHTAYRPYWNRPASAPLSDFGSTIGNDAGVNLWHEFEPSLQHLMKSHAPQFVLKITERVGQK
jgi:hypothetical protein